MSKITTIFSMSIITILMALNLANLLEVENNEIELKNNKSTIDSLISVTDSLTLKLDTLQRQSEIWDFGIEKQRKFLIEAMIHVESRNNDSAYCVSENAAGCLQIRPCMVFDVNRILKKQNKSLEYNLLDRWDRIKSIEMFHIYCNYYNLNTLEDMARAWNGGPRGVYKPATFSYWKKIKNQLES